jgi:rhodanese-related sulfurtransferase
MPRVTILGRQSLPALAVQALVLTALGALLGLGVNAVRAKRLPLVASSFDYEIGCEEAAVESKNRTLGVDETARLAARPGVVVVDIRAAEAYASGHIPQSKSVPVSILAPTDPAALTELARAATVIIVDATDDLVHAEEFAGELKGARDVRFLAPGFAGWTAAGRPVTTGATP